MADYYPVLARAVSSLAYHDAQARAALYARARTIVAEQMRRQNPQDPRSATLREQAALETAIRKVEAELRPSKTPVPKPPPRPPAKHGAGVTAKAPQNTAHSLAKILHALQADEPRQGDLHRSDRKPAAGKALVASAAKPIEVIRNRPIPNRSEELSGVAHSLGAMLFGLTYVMAALAFAGVTYIRCMVWVAQGVIGYPTLLAVMAITLGLFIAPPFMISRRALAVPSFAFLMRFLYSASRRVF